MQHKRKRISPDEHFQILQRFVKQMLSGIYGGLLASGVDADVAKDAANYIQAGLDNPLNNPFKPRKREPLTYRLGLEHWLTFSSFLHHDDHILTSMLVNPPYRWSVEEAYYEWKWLCAHLDPNSPKLSAKQDEERINRLHRAKAAWDASVEVRITVEIGDAIARSVILDQRLREEADLVLAKRGLEQMARGLNQYSFKKIDGKSAT
jgi:hypothetical protein